MAKHKTPPDDDKVHPFARKFLWLADEGVVKGFIWIPVVGLIISYMGGLLYKFYPDKKAPWEVDWLGPWAIIGFISYCFVVLSAEPLFKLLSRDEDYYGEGSDEGESDV